MKNILVTGGAGFIGSNLIKKLIDEGHNVTSLDNYSTGKTEKTSLRFLSSINTNTYDGISGLSIFFLRSEYCLITVIVGQ